MRLKFDSSKGLLYTEDGEEVENVIKLECRTPLEDTVNAVRVVILVDEADHFSTEQVEEAVGGLYRLLGG